MTSSVVGNIACGHTLTWESILSFISMEAVLLTYARSVTDIFGKRYVNERRYQ